MAMSSDVRTLAKQVLEAIRFDDAQRLAELLQQGAPPDGWWDPVEAAAEHARQREMMRRNAPKFDFPECPSDLMDGFEEAMHDAFGSVAGPSAYEIPLHLAAVCDSVDCLSLLLASGADVNKRDSMGTTALFGARSVRAIDELVRSGIDLEALSRFGNDAFQERFADPTSPDDDPSGVESDLSVCRALLNAGVPLVMQIRGKSRLYRAAFSEHLPGVRTLLECGHPIDADAGHNALHAICWHWDYGDARDENTRQIVRILLGSGFDASGRGEGGTTPLHEAMSGDGSNLVAADELLAAGADVNAVNDDGQTPLHLSYETLFDYDRVVPYLLERGANPLLCDKWGQTVLDIAQRMIAGENPRWRIDMCATEGGPPCGWKSPASPGDNEYQMLSLLEEASARFR